MKNTLLAVVATLVLFGSALAQDSLNIVKLCSVPMTAYQVEVRGDYAYVAAYNSGFVVMDISDPANPQEVGHCQLQNRAEVIELGTEYAFVWGGGYLRPNGVSAVDISDPSDPVEVGYYDLDEDRETISARIAVVGYKVFTYDGKIIDFSEPANPELVCEFEAQFGFNASDQYLYTSKADTLYIFDITDVHNPIEVSKLHYKYVICTDILLSDSLLFLVCMMGDVEVINVLELNDPQSIGYFRLDRWHDFPLEVKIAGGYFFDSFCLYATDISDPRNPVEHVGYYLYQNPGEFNLGVALGDNGLIYTSNKISFNIFRFTPPEADVKQDLDITPTSFALSTPYPNPFNATTTIGYSLPVAGVVRVAVYDLSGREVTRLADGVKVAGRHEAVWQADGMSSGVYVVALDVGGMVAREKVVLVR